MDNKDKRLIQIIIIIILITISMFLILDIVGDNKSKEYKTDNYKIVFDKNWSINSKNNNYLKLVHKSKSVFQVDIIILDEEYRRSDLSLLVDDIIQKIENDNDSYRLVNKNNTVITQKKYDAYQYLYETDDEQAMVSVGKMNDVIFILTYIADYQCFDILLDSVKEIIWNFEII